uniref:RxLR effector protein n=1 Tax=Phytophthora sojae TaxID=67593 RepID=G1FS10_PHYSO|nr:Avh200 [Phytophthora sojae]
MRVAPVLLLIAATFLAASEALSTTTDSNKVKTSQVILPSGPSLRLLRKHNKVVDEDEDSSEGRTLTDLQMAEMEKFAEKLGMNWARVQSGTMYTRSTRNTRRR